MTLAHKYRPTTFDEIVGNVHTVEALKAELESDERPHAYLIYGPSGCGKTTIGRIIKNVLGCHDQDFSERNAANYGGIDEARDLISVSKYKPMHGPCRVFLLDECHELTSRAQNAILKMLEEAPSHAYYILCTTEPENLLNTIKGRCFKYEVETLDEFSMEKLLRRTARNEGVKLTAGIYEAIIENVEGKPREALESLQKVITAEPENRLEVAKQFMTYERQVKELCQALIKNATWKRVRTILKGLKKQNAEQIRRAVFAYSGAVLLNNPSSHAARVMRYMQQPLYNTGFPGLIYACYQSINEN